MKIMNIFLNNFVRLVNMITVDSIMLARLLCGIYCDYSTKRIFKLTAKIYCIVLGVVIAIGTSYVAFLLYGAIQFNSIVTFRTLINLLEVFLEYEMCIVIALVSNGEYFYRIYSMLQSSTYIFGHDIDSDAVFSKLLFVTYIFVKIFHIIWYWVVMEWRKLFPFYLFIIPLGMGLGCNVYKFLRVILFELIWHRMRRFRKCFESTLMSRACVSTRQDFRDRVRRRLCEYKSLLDSLSSTSVTMQAMMLIQTITNLYNTLMLTYDIAAYLDFNYQSIPIRLANQIMEVFLLAVPGIWVSLTANEIEHMQLLIKKQMFLCTDEDERCVLQDALTYLTLRPFKYTVWRIFSVDVSMILGLASILTTSIIIIVQFSHVLD